METSRKVVITNRNKLGIDSEYLDLTLSLAFSPDHHYKEFSCAHHNNTFSIFSSEDGSSVDIVGEEAIYKEIKNYLTKTGLYINMILEET